MSSGCSEGQQPRWDEAGEGPGQDLSEQVEIYEIDRQRTEPKNPILAEGGESSRRDGRRRSAAPRRRRGTFAGLQVMSLWLQEDQISQSSRTPGCSSRAPDLPSHECALRVARDGRESSHTNLALACSPADMSRTPP